MIKNKFKVLVLDMQPIDPPIGGGRLRLLGLYHNLSENLSTQYIGSYDWPGEKFRDHQLTDSLREIDIPLSGEHFAECRKWQERVCGKTIIDTTFSHLAHLSTKYVEFVRIEVVKADIVIFSHPWVYPLVKDLLNKATQTIIYDSQNVEGYLRFTLLDDGNFGTEIVNNVVKDEYELCNFANVIFTCSFEDSKLFNKLYDVPFTKMKTVPNGVFIEKIRPVNKEEKVKIKKQLGLEGQKTVLFIGSNYLPNLEACNYIVNELAPRFLEITFVVAGGVGEGMQKTNQKNIKITGRLTEEEKHSYLSASDLAINPMFSGSGTNIKMFDFMAASLPVISTVIGSRGITTYDHAGILIRNQYEIKSLLQEIISDEQKIWSLGRANRELVEKNYSWERISPELGKYLVKKHATIITEQDQPIITNRNKKLALMSSWNLRCGIAEHSRYLTNEFEAKNVDYRIIANSNSDPTISYLVDDISRNIYPLWKYDYLNWTDTKIDIGGILNCMQQDGISKLNIQYHKGFYDQQILLKLVSAIIKAEYEVSITLHNPKELYHETLLELKKLGIKTIVHTSEEKILLQNQGICNVIHIPLGVLDFPDEDKYVCRNELGITGDPVIGSFGFLRPHKGVLEAIEAVSILRGDHPNIKFLGVNALYSSKDSEQYHKSCLGRIEELKLNDNVTLLTSFMEMNQIVRYLHATDFIILPYHDSKEGSSAAANTAISAKRPLIISKSGIFSEIKHVSYVVDDINPQTIATEIKNMLSKPDSLRTMKDEVMNYVNENSYKKIADQYIKFIFGDG